MKTLLVITLLSLTSCAFSEHLRNHMTIPTHSERSDPRDPTDSLTEIERCEQNAKWLDGSNACDLVVYKTVREYDEIYKSCLQNAKKKSDCESSYGATIMNRLRFKYPHADFAHADLWCQSEPVICNIQEVRGQVQFEMKIRESHIARRNLAIAERESEESDKNLERRLKRATIYNAIKPTNCTHQKIGNTVNTNCY